MLVGLGAELILQILHPGDALLGNIIYAFSAVLFTARTCWTFAIALQISKAQSEV